MNNVKGNPKLFYTDTDNSKDEIVKLEMSSLYGKFSKPIEPKRKRLDVREELDKLIIEIREVMEENRQLKLEKEYYKMVTLRLRKILNERGINT